MIRDSGLLIWATLYM